MTHIATIADVRVERSSYVLLKCANTTFSFKPSEIPALVKALELAAKPEPITAEDLVDSAVFYTGKHWRKLVTLQNGHFILVDEVGDVQITRSSLLDMRAHLQAWYTKEPT